MKLVDRAYRAWMLLNGAELTQRERWLRDAMLLTAPGQVRGAERSVGRGRSAPEKRSPN